MSSEGVYCGDLPRALRCPSAILTSGISPYEQDASRRGDYKRFLTQVRGGRAFSKLL